MGVFCVDRAGVPVFGTSSRLWDLLGAALRVLDAERVEEAAAALVGRDGHVPSWLARSWGDTLFGGLGDVVLVCRPLVGRDELHPVGVYRRGTAAAAAWSRAGEHLSVYDTPVVAVLLAFAQACTATGTGSGGFTVTTLRPPAPGSTPSPTAVRVLLRRSGLLRPLPPSDRADWSGSPPPPRPRRTS